MQQLKSTKIYRLGIKSRNNLKGFAMIEALVSILLLISSIMGPLVLSFQTAKYSRLALNRVKASYYADEALDLLVNYRHSMSLYCVKNSELPECAGDPSVAGFKLFINNIMGPVNNYCSSESRLCNIDSVSFNYTNQNVVPSFTSRPATGDCELYEHTNRSATCGNDGDTTAGLFKTVFKRKFYVEKKDNITTTNGVSEDPSTVKLVVVVCIDEKTECTKTSPFRVMLETYVAQ